MNKLILALCFFTFPVFAAVPPALTDAQITKVLLTINEGEIEAAKMAEKRSTNDNIKNFALMMETAHVKNKKETKELAKRNKIDTEKSDLSKSIEAEAKQSNLGLKKQKENTFDQTYVSEQISMHTKALDTINNTLLPAAQNQMLKDHLSATSKAVASHLDHAKGLLLK